MSAGELPKDDQPPDDSTDHRLDMDLLRDRMSAVDRKSRAGWAPSDAVIDLSPSSSELPLSDSDSAEFLSAFESLGTLWVIVFTNVSDGSDGVYSLSIGDESIVLAFEEREEAQRYSICLEAQEFPMPQVCELDSEELRNFCGEAGFRLGFVPKGSLISPPEESAIEDLDKWRGEPKSKHADRDSLGMSEEDIETMKKKLDSLFGQ